MRTINVPITEPTLEELRRLADRELRSPRDQAAFLLREAVTRRGAGRDYQAKVPVKP